MFFVITTPEKHDRHMVNEMTAPETMASVIDELWQIDAGCGTRIWRLDCDNQGECTKEVLSAAIVEWEATRDGLDDDPYPAFFEDDAAFLSSRSHAAYASSLKHGEAA